MTGYRWVVVAVALLAILLAVSCVPLALAGIWTGDERWGQTAFVAGAAAVVVFGFACMCVAADKADDE